MNNTDFNKTEYAKQLHNLRGCRIQIISSNCVKAKNLGLENLDGETLVALNIRFFGVAGQEENKTDVHPINDSYMYKYLSSPFSAKIDKEIVYAVFEDAKRFLWTSYFSQFFIKNPDLYQKGLQFSFFVPEKLAAKRPTIKVVINDEEIWKEVIEKEGEYTRYFSVQNSSSELIGHMMEVRRQQAILLQEFQRLCKTNNLQYYLICGGLIGAVRDGQLIPWDDDMDLAMPRADYDRFLEIVEKEWDRSSAFKLIKPEDYGRNIFLDFMTRIVYTKESIQGDPFERITGKDSALHHHLPIDIYILENTYSSRFRQWFAAKKILALYGIGLRYRDSFDFKDNNRYKRSEWVIALILRTIGKLIPLKTVFKAFNKIVGKQKHIESSSYYFSNGYYKCLSKTFLKEWFDQGNTISIDGFTFQTPKNSAAFLKAYYGDYMQYPLMWERSPSYIENEWIK